MCCVECTHRAAAKKRKQGGSYPLGDGELFGSLVRVVSGEGEGRECDTCHKVSPMKKMLLNSPDLGQWSGFQLTRVQCVSLEFVYYVPSHFEVVKTFCCYLYH